MDGSYCVRCGQDAMIGGLCAVCLFAAAHRADYTIINILGRGDESTAYLAQCPQTRRLVVVKVSHHVVAPAAFVQRVRHASHALTAASVENVTCAVAAGLLDGRLPYVAREYVRGTPITRFCERNAADRHVRRRLLERVCQTIAAAHEHGITHGGLTPSNVFVCEADGAPRVTISDFAMRIASPAQDGAAIDRLTAGLV
jgi:serine/threonine protein kinase